MTLLQLMEAVSNGYSDDIFNLMEVVHPKTGEVRKNPPKSDLLAIHIAREIQDTYDPTATNAWQLDEAARVLRNTQSHLEKTIHHLYTISTRT